VGTVAATAAITSGQRPTRIYEIDSSTGSDLRTDVYCVTGATMRINVYSEEITDRIEILQKSTEAGDFVGVRFNLELPVTIPLDTKDPKRGHAVYKGPFKASGDDASSAVTFWARLDKADKYDLRKLLRAASDLLESFYDEHNSGSTER
jgi:hypothetical protein